MSATGLSFVRRVRRDDVWVCTSLVKAPSGDDCCLGCEGPEKLVMATCSLEQRAALRFFLTSSYRWPACN